MSITYAREQELSAPEYVAVLGSTYMRDKRPLANTARISAMLAGSNVIVTARDDAGQIVGLARGITDGAWVCYVADLVVRDGMQGRGIGTGILDECGRILGPGVAIVMVSYPQAEAFYRRIGMNQMPAFYRDRAESS